MSNFAHKNIKIVLPYQTKNSILSKKIVSDKIPFQPAGNWHIVLILSGAKNAADRAYWDVAGEGTAVEVR